MTKAELVMGIAEKAGLKQDSGEGRLEAFVASVTASLKAGKEVRLVGFGASFRCAAPPAFRATPKPAPRSTAPPPPPARFRIGETLKNALN